MLTILKAKAITNNFDLRSEGFYCFINPWSYLLLRKNKDILENFDGIFFDGIIIVKLLRIMGFKIIRTSFDFTSLAPIMFDYWSVKNSRIALIGSTQNSLENSIKTFKSKFPLLNISFAQNGYFDSNAKQQLIQKLCHSKYDAIVVGLGTPLQERFLAELKNQGFKGTAFTCGGFLHQSAHKTQYYPNWINRFNLRAFYRMWDEPKLIKRYFIGYPLFLFYFCIDLLFFFISKK